MVYSIETASNVGEIRSAYGLVNSKISRLEEPFKSRTFKQIKKILSEKGPDLAFRLVSEFSDFAKSTRSKKDFSVSYKKSMSIAGDILFQPLSRETVLKINKIKELWEQSKSPRERERELKEQQFKRIVENLIRHREREQRER